MLHIIYDVDDVLNNLTDRMCQFVGVEPNTFYRIEDNDHYTDDEKRRCFEFFNDPDAFAALDFVPGATEIFEIEKTSKARVSIMSCNYNQQIVDIKMHKLLTRIPGAAPEKIQMQLLRGEDKVVDPSADIIVEDCLANCLKYPLDTLKILINKSYNQAATYNVNESAWNIRRVDSLLEANQLIREIIMEEGV